MNALPLSVRAKIADQFDWALLAVLAVSLALHFGGVIYLRNADWPRQVVVDVPTSWARPVVWKAPALPRALAEAPAPAAQAGPRRRVHVAAGSADRRARLAERARQMGMNLGIGALGPDGKVPDLLASGRAPADIETALKDVAGIGTASRSAIPLSASGPGTIARIDDLRAQRLDGGATADKGPERAPGARVRSAGGLRQTGGVVADPRGAAQVIEDGMGAIKACYERELKRSPGLGGRIGLAIDVNLAGRVTAVEAHEDTFPTSAVFDCIRMRVSAWRFPPARGASATILYPLIFEPISSR